MGSGSRDELSCGDLIALDPLPSSAPSPETTEEPWSCRRVLECLEARQIPSALLYDARGCFLFEEITRCREYYLTRTEMGLLRRAGSELAHAMAGADIIELGSGSCEKISVLLEAASLSGHVGRYIPIDVSESSIDESARALRRLHPNLVVQGIAADFFSGLERIPDGSRRLFCFLGSTLGNLRERERAALYHAVSRRMRRGETFLLGIDLVKDPGVIEAAYNDSAGVTAAFNLNVLNAINRLAGTDLDPKRFRHVAFYDQEKQRVEMHLEARSDMDVRSRLTTFHMKLRRGERLMTERSCKFRLPELQAELRRADLVVDACWTDSRRWFALLGLGRA